MSGSPVPSHPTSAAWEAPGPRPLAPEEPRRGLAAGDLLAGRYHVVRFVAAGGMGEVWEAFDGELRERVALKTVRPEIAADPANLLRFRREIQLARRVSHPAVCRTFDLVRHPRAGSDVVFLTMELLEGETLAARLRRRGALRPDEARAVAAQVAEGLAAAHDAGVVHRDLKPGNVLLVSTRRGERVVVTDFGLAVDVIGGDPLTADGATPGTPAYMAPEQVRGEQATPAADIYALGVVLFEMVTGRLPFEGRSALAQASARLTEAPLSPSRAQPGLDAAWERTILRCLARAPQERFASARDIARSLRGERIGGLPPRRLGRTLAAALLLTVGSLPFLFQTCVTRESQATAPRRAIAVFGFRDLAPRPEAAWLSTALSELLLMELAGGGALRPVPGETASRAQADLRLPPADTYAPATLSRIRAHSGADLVALGSFLEGNGRLRVDVRVQDAAGGETLATATASGPTSEILDLVAQVGGDLRRGLGLPAPGSLELPDAFPVRPEATRLYSEGLTRLRVFDALEARELLSRAISLEPGFALAHAALAEALLALGREGEALAASERAAMLSAGLPRESRLLVDAQRREAGRNWAAAIDAYRALHRFYPDDLEHGLRLARALTAAGEGTRALDELSRMRARGGLAARDPRLDLLEAQAALAVSAAGRALGAAERATAGSSEIGARHLLARARNESARALRRLGRNAEALPAAVEARAFFLEVGDRAGAGRAASLIGLLLSDQDRLAEAEAAHREALDLCRQVGYRLGEAAALNNLARLEEAARRLAAAARLYQRALGIARELGDRRGMAITLGNLALLQELDGDVVGARKLNEEALQIARELEDRREIATRLLNLGLLRLEMGETAGARELLDEALALRQQVGDRRGAARAGQARAALDVACGELPAARRRLTEALASWVSEGQERDTASVRSALADLELAAGRPAAAEQEARRALQGADRSTTPVEASLVLTRALAAQGRLGEAGPALERARGLAQALPALLPVVELAAAEVDLASGRPSAAAERLRPLAESLRATRRVSLELECRLTLGRAQAALDPVAGRDALTALARDARRLGLEGVAQRAEAIGR